MLNLNSLTRIHVTTFAVFLLGSSVGVTRAQTRPAEGARPATDSVGATELRPLLARYCFGCHGEKEQEADFRLDRLDPDFVHGKDAEEWHRALEMIEAAPEPPADEAPPSPNERGRLVARLRTSLEDAAKARSKAPRPVVRRLTKEQYGHTLRDLLGVDVAFERRLPDDGKSKRGFSNDAATLQASQLHLETFRDLARAALERAIVGAERPETTQYRVRFGKDIGKGKVAAKTGGYQAVPLSTNDFAIDILGTASRLSVKDQDRIRRKMSIGLRGSHAERFQVTEEGLMLFGALPHVEKAPGAWQGPSPNVKLEMQRVFPRDGDFVLRVRASRGYIPQLREALLLALDTPEDFTHIEDGRVVTVEHGIVLAAKDVAKPKNLVLEGDDLRPLNVPEESSADFRIAIPSDGYYQIDVVHRVVDQAQMPQIRVMAFGKTFDLRPEVPASANVTRAADAEAEPSLMVTRACAAAMRKGQHVLKIGGPFFTGFRCMVVTKLPDSNALVQRLTADIAARMRKVEGERPAIRAFVGTRTDDGMDYATFDVAQTVEAELGAAQTYVFRGRLENLPIPEPESGDNEELSGFMLVGLWNDRLVHSNKESGPPLLVEELEFEAPYYETWPPASHRAIFVERPADLDEASYTRLVLERFLARAYRRAVHTDEVERYFEAWRRVRAQHERNEDAVREVLVAVLTSPSFLFSIDEEEEAQTDFALASRLAYFLWNSPPDAQLLELASKGELRARLTSEVDRLLGDAKVERFVSAFVHEWLRLDRFLQMTVDPDRFPRFTRFVKRDMAEETLRFVHEVLASKASLATLIDADFTMLNQNLADFYGIDGVQGVDFRRVTLPAARRRGGVLTQGSFLGGHSGGLEPHPIKRAVWMRKQLLDDPPPPPPPNVPELDGSTPGFDKLTLKQKLEAHRDKNSCRDCHAGIDPYGIAFERYSAVGLFEERRKGQVIDASTTLPDGTAVDGLAGLRAWMLGPGLHAFQRGLARQLFAWAHGRDVSFADEAEITAILAETEKHGASLHALIHAVVAAPSFVGARSSSEVSSEAAPAVRKGSR